MDIFYEVVVQRNASAYDTTRAFTITVDDGGGNSVVEGQTLYIEHLVSQNRNSTDSVTGPDTVYVGQQVTWVIEAGTATQGYEELEHYLTLCPDIYRLDSVVTNLPNPDPPGSSFDYDTFWGDGCPWDTTTNSGCASNATKYGGDPITYQYNVTIIGAGTCDLYDMVYDFSGSSFHYNSNYPDVLLSVTALEPPDLQLTKTVSAGPYYQGDSITYTLTLQNTGGGPASNIVVYDVVPAEVSVTTVTPQTGSWAAPNWSDPNPGKRGIYHADHCGNVD